MLVLPAAGWARSGSVHVHGYTTRSGHYVAHAQRAFHESQHPSPVASQPYPYRTAQLFELTG